MELNSNYKELFVNESGIIFFTFFFKKCIIIADYVLTRGVTLSMKRKKYLKLLSLVIIVALLVNISTASQAKPKPKLNKTKLTLTIGRSSSLTLKNTNAKVKWSSSNKSVASVNSLGDVTAKKAGTANIKAKAGKKTYTCKVTVPKQYISKTAMTLDAGSSKTLRIYGVSSSDDIFWSSDDESIATVSSKGKVTALASGRTIIRATLNSGVGKTYKCEVLVYGDNPYPPNETDAPYPPDETDDPVVPPEDTPTPTQEITPSPSASSSPSPTPLPDIPVTGVELMETSLTLDLTVSRYLSANVMPLNATNRNVTWRSTNPYIARVTNTGMVTGLAGGITVIYVMTEEGRFVASCNVTVTGNTPTPIPTPSPTPKPR